MASIEQIAKKRKKKRNLQKAILTTIQVAGVISIAVMAPKVLSLFPRERMTGQFKSEVNRALTRLRRKNEVEFIAVNGKPAVRLTARGEQGLALRTEQLKLRVQNPKKWDGSYRLVIFDISEKRRRTRDFLRQTMSDVGFLRVQDSVWIFPYQCEEFIALLKVELRLGKEALYAVVDSIENDVWIRKHFNLPSHE